MQLVAKLSHRGLSLALQVVQAVGVVGGEAGVSGPRGDALVEAAEVLVLGEGLEELGVLGDVEVQHPHELARVILVHESEFEELSVLLVELDQLIELEQRQRLGKQAEFAGVVLAQVEADDADEVVVILYGHLGSCSGTLRKSWKGKCTSMRSMMRLRVFHSM